MSEQPGEYVIILGDDTVPPPLVDFTASKSPWSPDLLTATITARLRLLGQSLGRAARVESRRQWQIAEVINREWAALEREYRAEGVTREMYLAACSQWLNACAGWSLLTGSGETLRRWCDVARQFEGVRDVEKFKAALSFDHFFKARQLYNAQEVSSPVAALDQAVIFGWTADEMYRALSDPPVNGWDYEHFARRLAGMRDGGLDWLPHDDAEYIRARLDEIAQRLEEVVR